MHKRNGFTIVELLIVIVVIAILAAISVVAYNGIQDRAKNAQLLSSFDAAEKALRIYALGESGLPTTAGAGSVTMPNGAFYACIGKPSDYPAINGFAAGECLKDSGYVLGGYSSDLNNRLSQHVRNLSVDASANTISINSETITMSMRGIMYYSFNPAGGVLMYYQAGDQECGRGQKAYESPSAELEGLPDGVTICQLPIEL